MGIAGITNPDIIDDLLEGLKEPVLIVLRGSAGVGKALFITTLVKEYIERGLGKAFMINFMISEETSIRYSRKHGIDLGKYIREDKLRIRNITSIPFSGEGAAALYSALTEAADYVGDGIISIYPADLAFAGLELRDIVRVIGLIRSIMDDFGSKIILAFTTYGDQELNRIRNIFESIADFVFEISIKIPHAGVPRRYLTIVKPIGRYSFMTRTLELYHEYGTGYRLFGYAILPVYKVSIDPNKRLYTGIKIIDDLVDGFVKGSITALLGTTGTGKTVVLLTIMYRLAERGEKTLYISLEEPVEQLRQTLNILGLDYEKVKDSLVIMNINPRAITLHTFSNMVLRWINTYNVSVIAIDGIHVLSKEFGAEAFRVIKDLGYYSKSNGITLFMAQLTEEGKTPPLPPVSTIADVLIRLILERRGRSYTRLICIEKYRMRNLIPRCIEFELPLE